MSTDLVFSKKFISCLVSTMEKSIEDTICSVADLCQQVNAVDLHFKSFKKEVLEVALDNDAEKWCSENSIEKVIKKFLVVFDELNSLVCEHVKTFPEVGGHLPGHAWFAISILNEMIEEDDLEDDDLEDDDLEDDDLEDDM